MGLDLEYPAGATPLDDDEKAGLIPSHISNRSQLNAWETRRRYIDALRAADGRDYGPLLAFVRSGKAG